MCFFLFTLILFEDSDNWNDRYGEDFLFSPCVLDIFYILTNVIDQYFNLLKIFPAIAMQSAETFFGGLHNTIINTCKSITDCSQDIYSEEIAVIFKTHFFKISNEIFHKNKFFPI